MSTASSDPRRRTSRWPIRIGAIIVLAPCAYGFGTKFYEFLATFRASDDGVFVILPMINYLLATIGFSFLLFWSVMHGMFRDVEAPKYAFLAREAYLDGRRPPAFDDDDDDEDRGRDEEEPVAPVPPPAMERIGAVAGQREEAVCHG